MPRKRVSSLRQSPTARTSASCPTAIMRPWCKGSALKRLPRRDRGSRRPGAWVSPGSRAFHHRAAPRDRNRRPDRAALRRPDRTGAATACRRPAPRSRRRRHAGGQVNWIAEDQDLLGVKVRSLAPPVPARRNGDWVRFDGPEYGVAPGQAAVFYDGSRLLGGGWIAETVPADEKNARCGRRLAPVSFCSGEAAGETEVLLVKPGGPFWRKKDVGAWMIPKGMIEPGETPVEAALREFEEEVGIPLELAPFPLCRCVRRPERSSRRSRAEGDLDASKIRAFTSRWNGRPGAAPCKAIPEVAQGRWMRLAEAGALMLPSQLPMLDALEERLGPRAGTCPTITVMAMAAKHDPVALQPAMEQAGPRARLQRGELGCGRGAPPNKAPARHEPSRSPGPRRFRGKARTRGWRCPVRRRAR